MSAYQTKEDVYLSNAGLSKADIEAIEQHMLRANALERLLRYILDNGMTKEAYRLVGEALK